MIINFDKQVSRKNTNSVKWTMGGNNVLSFGIADMEFPCSDHVVEAIKKRADRQIFGYTGAHQKEYISALTGWFSKRFDWNFDGKLVHITHTVLEGITECIKAFTREGDGIIIQEPVYSPFKVLIEKENRTTVINKLIFNKGDGYAIDFDAFEAQAKEKNTTMFILCSPHNPVGRVWTKDELEKMADICHANKITIIADEIHCDIVRRGVSHIPLAKLKPKNSIITCISASKSFNLAGMEIANVIFPDKKHLKKIAPMNVYETQNPLSIAAATAAYGESEEWLNQMNGYVDQNFLLAKEWFLENLPEIDFYIPQGTYLSWVDVSPYTHDSRALAKKCLKEKALFYDGDSFGAGGQGFLRINFACPWQMLEQGLNRLKNALQKV